MLSSQLPVSQLTLQVKVILYHSMKFLGSTFRQPYPLVWQKCLGKAEARCQDLRRLVAFVCIDLFDFYLLLNSQNTFASTLVFRESSKHGTYRSK